MTSIIKDKKSKKDEVLNKNTIEINPQLQEESNRKVVVTFGRMNPPTAGHEKLINKVKEVARKTGAKAEIYLSHSQDAKKNPLSYDDKLLLAKEAFGPIVQKAPAKTIMDVMKVLQSHYDNVTFVVGADRVSEFDALLNKYNGKEFNFASINVISAGERDPDADGIEGMSASKMREAALNGDSTKFKTGLPKKLLQHADEIYTMVRAGMKISEEVELDEYVLSVAQRQKRAITFRRYEKKIEMARERLKRRIADQKHLVGRARKKAIQIIRKKVAGEKGTDYASLSPSEKIMIDKRVEKRKGAISKIAARLLPKVRKAEMQRVADLHQKSVKESLDEMFEEYLDESKRFHMAFGKDGKPKYDRRFKVFKHIIKNEEADQEMLDIIAEMYDIADQISLEEMKTIESLVEKAVQANITFEEIYGIYEEGILNGGNPFDHVNAYVANLKEDKGSLKHHLGIGTTIDHMFHHAFSHQDRDVDSDVDINDAKSKAVPDETIGGPNTTKKFLNKYGDEAKHSKVGNAFESLQVPTPVIPPESNDGPESVEKHIDASLTRAKKMRKFRVYHENFGAGFEGTDEVVQNFKVATPGEKGTPKKPKITNGINEAFEALMEANDSEISAAQMKEFEKFVDRMFEKYKIDFEFTKHFGERMNDDRNTPKIKLKELADLIKKIYVKHGNPLKDKPGAEMVVKDLQSDLNMPVVVKYDAKNDEIDIVAKTIMRKKNFSTPNPVIKY